MSVLNLLHLTSAFINILCIKSTPLDHSLYEHTYKPTATCKQEQQILTSTYIQNRTTHFFSNSCDLENRSGLLKLVPIKLSTGSHHVSFKHLAHTVSEIMPTIRPVPGRKHDSYFPQFMLKYYVHSHIHDICNKPYKVCNTYKIWILLFKNLSRNHHTFQFYHSNATIIMKLNQAQWQEFS